MITLAYKYMYMYKHKYTHKYTHKYKHKYTMYKNENKKAEGLAFRTDVGLRVPKGGARNLLQRARTRARDSLGLPPALGNTEDARVQPVLLAAAAASSRHIAKAKCKVLLDVQSAYRL